MPRGFTPTQSQAIRQKLLAFAYEKISETGVRKTSVEMLARAANISTGAFYKFFPSKEALFFEVYETLEDHLKEGFLNLLETVPNGNLTALKDVLSQLLASDDMQRLFTLIRKEELDYLLMGIEPQLIQQHHKADLAYMNEVIQQLHKRDFPISADAELLVAYVQGLFILNFEKEQLQPHAERVIDTFLNAFLSDLIH